MAAEWREWAREIEPRAWTTAPATDAEIAEAAHTVGAPFPEDYKTLLRQTNGLLDDHFGPILPLANTHPAPFVNGYGSDAVPSPAFPAYSLIGYTLMQRSPEFARLNGWGNETRALLSTFVVIGVDIGGNMFGFFAGGGTEQIAIRYIEHDTAELDDTCYSLEEYLRFYFAEAAFFSI